MREIEKGLTTLRERERTRDRERGSYHEADQLEGHRGSMCLSTSNSSHSFPTTHFQTPNHISQRDQYLSNLSIFQTSEMHRDFLLMMQQPINSPLFLPLPSWPNFLISQSSQYFHRASCGVVIADWCTRNLQSVDVFSMLIYDHRVVNKERDEACSHYMLTMLTG